jgi:hypothetical protein
MEHIKARAYEKITKGKRAGDMGHDICLVSVRP